MYVYHSLYDLYIRPEKLEEAPADPQVPLYHEGPGSAVDLTGICFNMGHPHLPITHAGLWALAAEAAAPGAAWASSTVCSQHFGNSLQPHPSAKGLSAQTASAIAPHCPYILKSEQHPSLLHYWLKQG